MHLFKMCYQVILCLCLFSVGTYGQLFDQTKVVYTNQGAIRGYRSANYGIFEFLNIPYATAPTGADKFKAPLPPPSWNNTFDAIDRGIICYQTDDGGSYLTSNTMHEDCLVANIYVPDTQDINLPVLVNVHGGGYHVGSGVSRNPSALVDSGKLIAVTFNYRVGIHGFLCLGTEVAPGNAGMKDQVALLRWVRENIHKFGGNPEEVTIAGCSAGGSSVDTLLLSNMTRSLFRKVIAESGCSLSSLAIQFNPLQNAIDHALRLNFADTSNITALGEFYASLSLPELIENGQQFLNSPNSYFYFVPCVERDLGQERFLESGPLSILKSGDLRPHPIMYGFASMEGSLRIRHVSQWIEAMNNNFSDFLTIDLMFENELIRQQVANEIREFYFGVGILNTSHVLSYIDYFSDVLFIHSILRAIPYHVSVGNNQVYLYEFAFIHNNSIQIPFANQSGTPHCHQYAITLGFQEPEYPSEEYVTMSHIMRQMYINFITTGNPNSPNLNFPFWPAVSANRYPYMRIDSNTTLVTDDHPLGEALANRTRFWDRIYEQYGTRLPIPPTFSASTLSIVSSKLWILCTLLVLFQFK